MDQVVTAGTVQAAHHPTLWRVVALWLEKQAGRLLPRRSDFDPTEMRYALGDISLFDVEDSPRRFWCRLDGTKVVELFGVDCTGRYLDTCFDPEYYAIASNSFNAAVDERSPGYYRREILYWGRIIRYEVAVLPLSDGGDRVNKLMIVLTPHWR